MLQNNRHHQIPRTRGFSLTELLVAMAVFISLMAGLSVLFSGAVRTVRGSYQLLDAYEVGRSAVDVIDKDLRTVDLAADSFHKQCSST